jgi:phage baseplate assembly protein W
MDKSDFLGRGWSFPPAFPRVGNKIDVAMVSGEEDIRESLGIILSVQIGERLMQPEFGADMNVFVFQAMSVSNQLRIKRMVSNAIEQFEPRIQLDDVTLTELLQEGKIFLNIAYTVLATNQADNFVWPFYLNGGI